MLQKHQAERHSWLRDYGEDNILHGKHQLIRSSESRKSQVDSHLPLYKS